MKLLKTCGLLSMLCLSATPAKADVLTKVTLEEDTNVREFTMYDTGKMYFSGSQLVIDSVGNGNLMTVALASINKMLFSTFEVSESGETNLLADASKLEVLPSAATETIKIVGVDGVFPYQILNVSGSLALQGNTTNHETIDITPLASGVYFIRVNGSILKFVKL